jgi:hypothetical protein
MYEDLNAQEIKKTHFDNALKSLGRSVRAEQIQCFESFSLTSGVQSI